jgi:cytochrome c-type biogenesis protein CcmF
MEINYIGEHLIPGYAGNFFVILAFIAALVATVAYGKSSPRNQLSSDNQWLALARKAFHVHAFAVFGIIGTLFYMIVNHYFEYQYVWQHSSRDLPMRYMLSCFWEGQEGSFLLWSFWHVILGLILICTSREWEAPVMAVFSSVQVFLASMLLGVYFFDYRIGSSPFILLREHPDYAHLPFTKVPNYLENLDGRGLNPLLRNYWMTIHPPTLFLGFASTLVPFAFAIAALWTRRVQDWVKPALPWTFFSVMILGTGVLMGGAWAYEALSFGGFWAWDPVENASLVPWLTLVGAGHVMLIYRNRKQSLFTVFFLTLITFILILYSTFLTRSGILGDTSVHAFTDLGMSGQLLVYLLSYVVLAIILIIRERKAIFEDAVDDNSTSREFWMFIGSLVLLVAGFQIIFTTSIPVINKVFGSNLAPPTDAIKHYNSWQIPFAIITVILIAVGQFFKYKKTELVNFNKQLLLSTVVSLAVTAVGCYLLEIDNLFLILLFFGSFFATAANSDYLFRILKGRIKKGGASIAHVGFALIMLGALISAGKSRIISQNTSGIDITSLGKDFKNNENIMLMKGDTLRMSEYYLTYKGKRVEGVNHYFDIDYFKKSKDGAKEYQFTLSPVVQTNPRMGNAAEPDTRHFLHKDVYTHVTYADLSTGQEHDHENFLEPKTFTVKTGDTIYTSGSMVIYEGINKTPDVSELQLAPSDLAVSARLKILQIAREPVYAEPLMIVSDGALKFKEDMNDDAGLKFMFSKIHTETGEIDVIVSERERKDKDFIIMKAIVFPMINILWIGCILMIIGTVLAIVERIRINNIKSVV